MPNPDFRAWHHVGHRILRPFADQQGKNAEGELRKTGFCLWCREYGTGIDMAAAEGRVYAIKKVCRRCGGVIDFAIYNQGLDPALQARALAWAKRPEEVMPHA